jgi:hypothetical protein
VHPLVRLRRLVRVQRQADVRLGQVQLGQVQARRSALRRGPEALQGPLAAWLPEQRFPEQRFPEQPLPEQPLPEHPLPEAALARAVDLLVRHPVRGRRLVSRREPPELLRVPSVPFWRRLAVSQGYPAHSSQGHLSQEHLAAVPSHAHAAALRARHWARHWVQPGASARLAPAPLRVARGAPVLRQEAGHAVAARPALRDAAQGLLREAEAPPAGAAVVQRARDAGALRPEEARDAAALRPEEVPGAAVPQRAAQHVAAAAGLPWAARPSAHLSVAVSVFRQDRVRLGLVQRRSERSARATACL